VAADLVGHIESCVNNLNLHEELSPISIFKVIQKFFCNIKNHNSGNQHSSFLFFTQAMAEIHNNAVARDALKEYKAYVTADDDKEMQDMSFLSEATLLKMHIDIQKSALDYFGIHQMGDAESNAGILGQLTKVGNVPF